MGGLDFAGGYSMAGEYSDVDVAGALIILAVATALGAARATSQQADL